MSEWRAQDRIQRYKKKLKKLISDEELAVTRRSLTLNVGAANRFIDAAIPDLPEDQKKALRKVRCLRCRRISSSHRGEARPGHWGTR